VRLRHDVAAQPVGQEDPAVARRILDHQPIAGIEICRDQTLARMDQHPAQLITKQ
jgi:hypothetical protein